MERTAGLPSQCISIVVGTFDHHLIHGFHPEGRKLTAIFTALIKTAQTKLETPIVNPQSSIHNRQSAIVNLQSSIRNRQSTIANPQSPIHNRQSAIVNPQSSIHNRQSAIKRKGSDHARIFHPPVSLLPQPVARIEG
jgi:hypothetical protein